MPDPDRILDQIRLAITGWEMADAHSEAEFAAASNLVALVSSLDHRLSRGEALPGAWSRAKALEPPSSRSTEVGLAADSRRLLDDPGVRVQRGVSWRPRRRRGDTP
jgi:hypothetical protein